MQNLLIFAGSSLTVIGTFPYLINVVKRKTKPRIVSWFTWTLLTAIASAASFAEGDVPSGVLTLVSCLITLSVVILGFKYGDRKFEMFDIVAQVSALAGLSLWFYFNNPLIALVASVTIDLIGGLPTLKHSWQKPNEETASAFGFGAVGAFLVLLSVGEITFSGLLFPVYLTVMNTIFFVVIVSRRKFVNIETKESYEKNKN